MEQLIAIAIAALPLVLGLIAGSILQRRHLASLREREDRDRAMPVNDLRQYQDVEAAAGSEMLLGSVVLGVDHFRVFLAGFRKIFGGEVRSYDRVLQRARREALARLREQACGRGYNAVANVRYESAVLAFGRGMVMVEVLAYVSAYRSHRGPACAS